MNFTKIVKAELDFPRRELSDGGLAIVVALTVFRQLIFVCFYWRSNQAVGLSVSRLIVFLVLLHRMTNPDVPKNSIIVGGVESKELVYFLPGHLCLVQKNTDDCKVRRMMEKTSVD